MTRHLHDGRESSHVGYKSDLSRGICYLKDYVKYLGPMIDPNLSWKCHIESIWHKISKSIGMIAKIRHLICPASCFIFSLRLTNCPLLNLRYLCLGKLYLDFSKKDRNSTKTGLTSVSTLV